jgi:hypothetical protein
MNTRIWNILSISLVMTCVAGLSVAGVVDAIEPVEPVETGFCRSHAKTLPDFTEGGHLEPDSRMVVPERKDKAGRQ